MTPDLFKYALRVSLVVVIVLACAWYFFAPTVQAPDLYGTIEGFTNFPSEFIPVEIVCAEPVEGGAETCVEVSAGDADKLAPPWKLSVPAGMYYISSHVKDPADIGSDLGTYRAYYTMYVTCGLKYECKDHTKIPVKVESGKSTTGIAPYDWYVH